MTYNQAIKKFNYSGKKTLRTVFDYLSHEWNDTLLHQKSAILKDLITEKYALQYHLEQYINFYAKELYNKDYVVLAIPKSINIIYRNTKDEHFKEMLSKQYLKFMLQSEICIEYQLEIPNFIKKDINFKEYYLEGKEESFEDIIFIAKYNYLQHYKEIAEAYEEYLLADRLKKMIEIHDNSYKFHKILRNRTNS